MELTTTDNHYSFTSLQEVATSLAKSNLVADHFKGKPADILLVLQMGRELDIKPIQALSSINVIKGKPTISPQLMIALIRGKFPNSHISYKESKKGDVGHPWISCTMCRDKSDLTEAYTATWDFERAKAMQLTGKDNYLKQPEVMLRWRAISECARVVFPDILLGTYVTDEIEEDDAPKAKTAPTIASFKPKEELPPMPAYVTPEVVDEDKVPEKLKYDSESTEMMAKELIAFIAACKTRTSDPSEVGTHIAKKYPNIKTPQDIYSLPPQTIKEVTAHLKAMFK